MPHLILEHSEELAEKHDLHAIAQELFDVTRDSGVFDVKDIKTRTIDCKNVIMGTENQTFAHLTLRMVAGRPLEVRQKLASDLLAVLEKHMPQVGALSVLPIDMDKDIYLKRVL
jgi:5-carboxymethyl-2-hydroxymuconate isomerase